MSNNGKTITNNWVEDLNVIDDNTVAVTIKTAKGGKTVSFISSNPLFGDRKSLLARIKKDQ